MSEFVFYSALALNVIACINIIFVCRKYISVEVEYVDKDGK